eukprot:scaffold130556_cov81-Phaeocystis_antarctica.AAC.2
MVTGSTALGALAEAWSLGWQTRRCQHMKGSWRPVSVRCYLWPTSTLCCSTVISRPAVNDAHETSSTRAYRRQKED